MLFPRSGSRETEAPRWVVLPTEVEEGGSVLWGAGQKADKKPGDLLVGDLGIGGSWNSSPH